jgi:hypothetical protein
MSFFKKILYKKKKELEYTEKQWLKELDWANVYHDSIRGKSYIENLSLNIGRWAGNYAFFYVLNRIMHDFKPKKIIELGLGESTKFVSSCIKGINYDCEYIIIEQSKEWKSYFETNFVLPKKTYIKYYPTETKNIQGFDVNIYKDLNKLNNFNADLYIIDGPKGSKRFSRYDIYFLAEKFNKHSEFIILLDDCQRQGEEDTFSDLQKLFKEKGISYFVAKYSGIKTLKLIVTSKYKLSTTF